MPKIMMSGAGTLCANAHYRASFLKLGFLCGKKNVSKIIPNCGNLTQTLIMRIKYWL